jgi:predicted transposase/invertase (TIGR01784 family)
MEESMDKYEAGCATAVKKTSTPHDEAFKKLLQTFFAEFIELFFPELDRLLDHSQSRFLMQELLVDIVGEESKHVDLLLETRYNLTDAYVLVHLEPQSYHQSDFPERMFIYFGRLFERHRKLHKLIIPIAIFTSDDRKEEPDMLTMGIPEHNILQFHYLKVKLKKQNWRKFLDSGNPVAAALLAKMGYNKEEAREVRMAYLRMVLRLSKRLDDARLALVMSVADLYFDPIRQSDEDIFMEMNRLDPVEGEAIMELMPAWKRWGYEEGIAEGLEEGIEKGIEKGLEKGREEAKRSIALKLLAKGFTPEEVADTLEIPIEEIRRLVQ